MFSAESSACQLLTVTFAASPQTVSALLVGCTSPRDAGSLEWARAPPPTDRGHMSVPRYLRWESRRTTRLHAWLQPDSYGGQFGNRIARECSRRVQSMLGHTSAAAITVGRVRGLFMGALDDIDAVAERLDAAVLRLVRTHCGLWSSCDLLRVPRRGARKRLTWENPRWPRRARNRRPADASSLTHHAHGTRSGTVLEGMRRAASL